MNKMKLDLDALDVQSFEVGEDHGFRGTIRARQETYVLGGCGDTATVPAEVCVGGGGGGSDFCSNVCSNGCTQHQEYTCLAGCAWTTPPGVSCYNTCYLTKFDTCSTCSGFVCCPSDTCFC